MQKITFRNCIFSKTDEYNLLAFTPNDGEVSRQESKYYGQDGADYSNSTYEVRVCKLDGHIIADTEAEMYEKRQKLITNCDGKTKTTIQYEAGANTYYADAIADLPQFGERQGYCIPFTVYFNLYNFYWKKANIASANFASTITINNTGTVETPYILSIVGTTTAKTPTTPNTLVIANTTTGQAITLTYNIVANEILTLNTADYTFVSSTGGNIISKITTFDTFFDKLAVGNNSISIANTGGSVTISAQLTYAPLFVGV